MAYLFVQSEMSHAPPPADNATSLREQPLGASNRLKWPLDEFTLHMHLVDNSEWL